MSSKIMLTLAFVCSLTITVTFAQIPDYPCDDCCKENWIRESFVSRIKEYQERLTEDCGSENDPNVIRINGAINDTIDRVTTELVSQVVPNTNAVAFFPILALINLVIVVVLLLITLLTEGAGIAGYPAGYDPSSLNCWYEDSYNRIQQFYYSTPQEIIGCTEDYIDTVRCILQQLYETITGECAS